MKIIQIITADDDIFGLCDGGQLWRLHSGLDPTINTTTLHWELMETPHFVRRNSGSEVTVIQHNDLKINLTGE